MYSRSHKRGIIRHSLKNCQENYYLVLALSGTRSLHHSSLQVSLRGAINILTNVNKAMPRRESVHSSKQNLWTITYGFQHLLSSISSYHLHPCQESMWAEKIFELASQKSVSSHSKDLYPPTRRICAVVVVWWFLSFFIHSSLGEIAFHFLAEGITITSLVYLMNKIRDISFLL